MKKIGLILLGLLQNLTAFGATAGWTEASQVVEITPSSQMRYEFKLALASSSDCKNKQGFFQDYSTIGAEFMFRVLLQAMSDAKPVYVYTTGRCDLDGNEEVSAVRLVH